MTNSVERYSPATDSWTTVKSMNVCREDLHVNILNGKIYVISDFDRRELDSVEFYAPSTDTWTRVNISIFLK